MREPRVASRGNKNRSGKDLNNGKCGGSLTSEPLIDAHVADIVSPPGKRALQDGSRIISGKSALVAVLFCLTGRRFACLGLKLCQSKAFITCAEREPSCTVRFLSVSKLVLTTVLLLLDRERFWQFSLQIKRPAGLDLGVLCVEHEFLAVVKLPDLGFDLILGFARDCEGDVELSYVLSLGSKSIGIVFFDIIWGAHLSALLFICCRTKIAHVELEQVV